MRVKLLIQLPNTQHINEYAKPWLVKRYPVPTHLAMTPKERYIILRDTNALYL